MGEGIIALPSCRGQWPGVGYPCDPQNPPVAGLHALSRVARRDHGLHVLGPSPESSTRVAPARSWGDTAPPFTASARRLRGRHSRAQGLGAHLPATGLRWETTDKLRPPRGAGHAARTLCPSYPALRPQPHEAPQPPLRRLSSPARRRGDNWSPPREPGRVGRGLPREEGGSRGRGALVRPCVRIGNAIPSAVRPAGPVEWRRSPRPNRW